MQRLLSQSEDEDDDVMPGAEEEICLAWYLRVVVIQPCLLMYL